MLRNWISRWPFRQASNDRPSAPRSRRLLLELLEDRALPSINITVTSLAGTAGSYDNVSQQATTLAAAIAQANSDNDGDTVIFQAGLAGPIDLSTADGGVGTLTLSGSQTIQGPTNNGITIEGGATSGAATNAQLFVINSGATVSLSNLAISNGFISSGNGGGISNDGTLTLTDSTLSNNLANSGDGGGIFNSGTLTVSNSAFAHDSANDGGGILNLGGMLTVTSSTFANDSATKGYGGGIWNFSGALTATNSTFANDSASGYGGGIENNATLAVANSTFANNTAGLGGGGLENDGTATLTNDLLAQNKANDYAGGSAVNTSSNNLIQTDAGSGLSNGVNGNIIGAGVTDSGLDPTGLANNGGSTQTIALLPGSQAIDAGSNSVLPSADQRGITRSANAVDIGAYQTEITLGDLPNPSFGAAYNQSLSASGGAAPYAFAVTNGSPPSGLYLSNNAIIGVPSALGTWTFVVAATDSSTGVISGSRSYTLTVSGAAPTVTQNPTNQTADATGAATFTAAASDGIPTPTTVQWQSSIDGGATFFNLQNNSFFSGVATTTLTITGATTAFNGYQFEAVFSNAANLTATTTAATLTVNSTAPTVTLNPTNQSADNSGDASFTAAASNGFPAATTVQWQVSTDGGATFFNLQNNSFISGVTTDTLSITGATTAFNGYEFHAVFSNAANLTATTTAATLTVVGTAPTVTLNPTNETVDTGSAASFTAAASAGFPTATSVQWQVSVDGGATFGNLQNNSVISGVTTGTLSIASASTAFNGYEFRAVFSNAANLTATTTVATLTINTIVYQSQYVAAANSYTYDAYVFAYEAYATGTGSYTAFLNEYVADYYAALAYSDASNNNAAGGPSAAYFAYYYGYVGQYFAYQDYANDQSVATAVSGHGSSSSGASSNPGMYSYDAYYNGYYGSTYSYYVALGY